MLFIREPPCENFIGQMFCEVPDWVIENIRKPALEEAARVVEGNTNLWRKSEPNSVGSFCYYSCNMEIADAIRALK